MSIRGTLSFILWKEKYEFDIKLRNYKLDLDNLVIHFSSHHENKLICGVAGNDKNVDMIPSFIYLSFPRVQSKRLVKD